MSKGLTLPNERTPVVVYNAEKQEPIAIFRSCADAAKVVIGQSTFSGKGNYGQSVIHKAACKKQRILPKSSNLDFIVSVRIAHGDYLIKLGDADFVLIGNSLERFTTGLKGKIRGSY